MRLGMIAVFALGLAPLGFAQRSFNPLASGGNGSNPGTPHTSSPSVNNGAPPNWNPLLGSSLPTLGPIPPLGPGFGSTVPRSAQGHGRYGGGRGYGGAVYVPVPVYSGGGTYYGGSGTVHNPSPGTYDPIFGGYNPGVEYQQADGGYPAPQQSPTVIINQNFQPETVHPVIHDYTNTPLPPPDRGPAPQPGSQTPGSPGNDAGGAIGGSLGNAQALYLIAMKDHTIYPALAYWIDNDTLNYVTMQGTPNRVSLSLVDRELSQRLNDERGLSFKLPPLQ